MSRKQLSAVALVLVAGLLAHGFYWYSPRERAGTPVPGDLPSRLLDDARASFTLWLPYPHQNLAAAAEEAGDLEVLAAALARRGHGRPPEIPRFGPFLAPPAREVGAAWTASGDVVIAARVYPALALIGRLAGKVAGNPWLAGGDVELGGKPATVTWQGTLWIAKTAGAALPATSGPTSDALPAGLGAFRLGTGAAPLPPGRYLVHRDGQGSLEAILAGTGLAGTESLPEFPLEAFERAETALLAVRGAARSDWREPFERPGAMALFSRRSSGGLPGSAVFSAPDQEPWKLPARGLSELFSGKPTSAEAEGLKVVAPDKDSLAAARVLAPALAPWLVGHRQDLVLGLWLAPKAARKTLGGATELLDELPFLGHRREAEALEDWRLVLAPLEDSAQISVVVFEHPDRARIALVPKAGEASSAPTP